jgi:hypothetical protein
VKSVQKSLAAILVGFVVCCANTQNGTAATASMQRSAPSVITCGVLDAQTAPVRSSVGFTAVLKMHSEDDHSKNTHLCAAEYSLQIIRPDGSSIQPFDFGYSDDDWDRPLVFRVEGFSLDGHRAFVFISDGSYPGVLQILEYDMSSSVAAKEIFLDQHFTRRLSPECTATLHIVGTSSAGRIVLGSSAKDGCTRAESWELHPNKTAGRTGGTVLPEYPRHLSSSTGITKVEAGLTVKP